METSSGRMKHNSFWCGCNGWIFFGDAMVQHCRLQVQCNYMDMFLFSSIQNPRCLFLSLPLRQISFCLSFNVRCNASRAWHPAGWDISLRKALEVPCGMICFQSEGTVGSKGDDATSADTMIPGITHTGSTGYYHIKPGRLIFLLPTTPLPSFTSHKCKPGTCYLLSALYKPCMCYGANFQICEKHINICSQ